MENSVEARKKKTCLLLGDSDHYSVHSRRCRGDNAFQ